MVAICNRLEVINSTLKSFRLKRSSFHDAALLAESWNVNSAAHLPIFITSGGSEGTGNYSNIR